MNSVLNRQQRPVVVLHAMNSTCLNCGASSTRGKNKLNTKSSHLPAPVSNGSANRSSTRTLRPRKRAHDEDEGTTPDPSRRPTPTIPEVLHYLFNIDLRSTNMDLLGDLVLCGGCADIMSQLYSLHKELDQLRSDVSFLGVWLNTKANKKNQDESPPAPEVPSTSARPRPHRPATWINSAEPVPTTTIQMFEVDDGELNVLELKPVPAPQSAEEEEDMGSECLYDPYLEVKEENGSDQELEMDEQAADPEYKVSASEDEDSNNSDSSGLEPEPDTEYTPRRRIAHDGHPKKLPGRNNGGLCPAKSVYCSICAKPYAGSHGAKRHIRFHLGPEEKQHADTSTFVCWLCRNMFMGKEVFAAHQASLCQDTGVKSRKLACQCQGTCVKPRKPTLRCPDCCNSIGGNSSNGSHVQGQQIPVACPTHKHQLAGLLCKVCGRELAVGVRGGPRKGMGMDHHLWLHIGREERDALPRDQLCPHCGKTFVFGDHLRLHTFRVHGSGATWQGNRVRKPVTKSAATAHVRYKCPKCDDEFTLEKSMRTHLKLHIQNEAEGLTFPCRACSQVFGLRHKMLAHQRQCEGFAKERPHQCEGCEKRFQTRKDLNRHFARVHLGKKKNRKYKPVADPSRRKGRWKVKPTEEN